MSANIKLESLGDVTRHGCNVAVACSCGQRAVIDGNWLYRMFFVRRWDVRWAFVGSRLRCHRCGARPDLVRATRQRPTLDLPPRTDKEWQRLARKLRG